MVDNSLLTCQIAPKQDFVHVNARSDSTLEIYRTNGELQARGDTKASLKLDPYIHNGSRCYTMQAGWNFDGKSLDVYADRLGLIPIFVRFSTERIIVSTSLEAICRMVDSSIDYDALAVFLRIGFFVGNDTPVEDVKVMSPNERFSWPAQQPNREWMPRHPTATTLDRHSALEMYAALFDRAVAERAESGEALGLPLSGGRDSRHIAYSLNKCGFAVRHAWTVETDSSKGREDGRVASLVAKELGWSHIVVHPTWRSDIQIERAVNRATHYLTNEHFWLPALAHAVSSTHSIDIVFDGLGGDVLSNGLLYNETLYKSLKRNDLKTALTCLIGSPKELPYLSQSAAKKLSFERAARRLERELNKHVESPNPLASFIFWNRTRRKISSAPVSFFSNSVDVAFPYLSPALFDFLRSLPGEQYAAPGFHDEVISEAFPRLGAFGYESPSHDRPVEKSSSGSAYIKFLLRNYRSTYFKHKFIWPRAFSCWRKRNISPELWWLNKIVYLCDLEKSVRPRRRTKETGAGQGNGSATEWFRHDKA